MARRHRAVVILLPVSDFAALESSASEHDHDTYLHAHWLLAQSLGLQMPVSPDRSDVPAPERVAQEAAS